MEGAGKARPPKSIKAKFMNSDIEPTCTRLAMGQHQVLCIYMMASHLVFL